MSEQVTAPSEGQLLTAEMCLTFHIYYIPVNVRARLSLVTHVIHSSCDAPSLRLNQQWPFI